MNAREMEAAIVRNAVHELLDHGFTLSVDTGGEDYEIDRSVDAEAVIAALKSQLANFKIPKKCFVVAELPRNTMGKVQKNLLRDQYKGLF